MTNLWYYSHAGITHGPLTQQQVKEHVAQKKIAENDLVWQGSPEPKNAVAAKSILEFSPAPPQAVPDWLGDVAKAESKGPAPVPVPSHESPEWLEDLRLWMGLELYAAAKQPEQQPTTTAATSTPVTASVELPDWLESFRAAQP